MELKSFFRYLGRNKTYTLINVIGFALSLAFVILTMAYTWQESTVDHFHKDADRIYVVFNGKAGEKPVMSNSMPPAYWLKDNFADIEAVCPVAVDAINNLNVRCGDKEMQASSLFAESNFFTFFSYPLLSGSPESVLADPYSVVISENFAKKMFGNENPVGKSLQISDSTFVTVTGVHKTFRRTLLPERDLLMTVDRLPEFHGGIGRTNNNSLGSVVIYIKMYPGKDLNDQKQAVLDLYRERNWFFFRYENSFTDVSFVPLKEAYNRSALYSVTSGETMDANMADWGPREGDPQLIRLLWVISLLVLLFAMANYVNLSVAQAQFRFQEAATRRLLGASRMSVQGRLLAESFLLTLVSYLLAWLLALALRPWAESLLQESIDLALLWSPLGIALNLLLVVGLSLLSGLLPSALVASAKPVNVIKGSFRRSSKMVLGKVFVAVQAGLTFLMLASALLVSAQVKHLVEAPLGYETRHLLSFAPYEWWEVEDFQQLSDRLSASSYVKRVGMTVGLPFFGGNNITNYYNGKQLSGQFIECDTVVFNMLGLHVLAGSREENPEGYFLTRSGFDSIGIPYDADYVNLSQGQWLQRIPLCGVIADFHRGNVLWPETFFFVRAVEPGGLENVWALLMEVQGSPVAAYQEIKRIVDDFRQAEYDMRFLDQQVQESFLLQMRLGKIVSVYAMVALLVSLLGLVAMSVFYMRQRLQEVAVRKVFGADNGQVFWHLVKPFMACVGIGILLGLPLAWYLTDLWISGFSYRISGIGWLMALVAAFCLLVSFAAVGIQGRIASRTNPAENIKAE